MYCGDEVSAIVADIGTHTSKFGFGGEDMPKTQIPSTIGYLPGESLEEGKGDGAEDPITKYFLDQAIFQRRDNMVLRGPLEDGNITSWDVVDQLWQYVFQHKLMVDPKDHPVVLAEPAFCSATIREQYAQLMFERYESKALYFARSAVLAAFASGRATATVVEAGAGGTTVAPVCDGYVLKKGVARSAVGGDMIDQLLLSALQQGGANVRPRYAVKRKLLRDGSFEVTPLSPSASAATHPSFASYMTCAVTRDAKESCCRVWMEPGITPAKYGAYAAATPPVVYELPDGTRLTMGLERFTVPEMLFNPGQLQLPGGGGSAVPLHEMVHSAVFSSDADSRKDLLQNVVLSGGTSLITGLVERLHCELTARLPTAVKARCLTPAAAERKAGVWIGGSILASLGSFQQLWLSKEEYEEHGASLLHRRCA